MICRPAASEVVHEFIDHRVEENVHRLAQVIERIDWIYRAEAAIERVGPGQHGVTRRTVIGITRAGQHVVDAESPECPLQGHDLRH